MLPVPTESVPALPNPLQATLPLFIHYYSNKNAIHELDQIQAMPYLYQSLYGHGDSPFLVPEKMADSSRLLDYLQQASCLALAAARLGTGAVGPNKVLAVLIHNC